MEKLAKIKVKYLILKKTNKGTAKDFLTMGIWSSQKVVCSYCEKKETSKCGLYCNKETMKCYLNKEACWEDVERRMKNIKFLIRPL